MAGIGGDPPIPQPGYFVGAEGENEHPFGEKDEEDD